VSIIRVGLAETKGFDEGWDAIFGKKKKGPVAPKAKDTGTAKTKQPTTKKTRETVAAKVKPPVAVAEKTAKKATKTKVKAGKSKKKASAS
jgi:hypothetical protein